MKKLLIVSVAFFTLSITPLAMLKAQDEPMPKKDSVNMDTIVKPTFYYAIEDEVAGESGKGGSASTVVIIAAGIIIAGVAAIYLLKKKK